MRRATNIAWITASLLLAGASATRAQEAGGVFLDVNIGIQAPSQTLQTNTQFQLYGETASVLSTQTVGLAPVVDGRLGYHVSDRFGVAFAVSGTRDTADAQGVANVPSPILFGSPTVTTLTASGLQRREIGYHFQFVWYLRKRGGLELSLYGGPSLIHLRQDVPTATASGQNLSVSSATETANAFGGNGGLDGTYMMSPSFGVGFFARYAGGSADIPSATGVRVGGFQGGGGLRVHF
jgi:hypothetical protein